MSTKKMEQGGEVVTEARLAVLLSRFAQAADASLNLKMEQMREEILSELRPAPAVDARGVTWSASSPPTDSEGAE